MQHCSKVLLLEPYSCNPGLISSTVEWVKKKTRMGEVSAERQAQTKEEQTREN